MTILILMSQAVLGSFTVVFALMMLLRAENSLSGRYAELISYFWYIVPSGTLLLIPLGVCVLLPISSSSSRRPTKDVRGEGKFVMPASSVFSSGNSRGIAALRKDACACCLAADYKRQ